MLRPCSAISQQRIKSSFRSHCKTPRKIPAPLDCFSQGDDHPELSAEGLSPVAGGIVALGKFDALHIGHRELAIQAARIGTPYLLSFVGLAEVLGWKPRAPIVAKCDRKRVLSSWASYCGNIAPVEFEIEFASVRHLNPQQFVEKLSRELRVCGVVAGENYRFGYRASGDASELVRLCKDFGISAYIINSVMDKNQVSVNTEEEDSKSKERGQVSSTRVRHALAAGDVRYVTELLGRPHRVISRTRTQDLTSKRGRISLQTSSLLNLPPGNGVYKACSLIVGDKHPISCKVIVDTSNLYIETEEERFHNSDESQEFQLLGIEFG
jgi:FAD synthase